jgi:NADH-quinone oxidoreductase subunit J
LPFDLLLFYLFGLVAIVTSVMVIAKSNPIYSVLLLITSFGALAGLYVLLDAPFVAVTQIIVYAGAIMVLFLFVVMLLNAPGENSPGDPPLAVGAGARRFGGFLSILLLLELWWALSRPSRLNVEPRGSVDVMSVVDIGRRLFTTYAFAFEVTSILILVAMLGAVVIARSPTNTEP